MFNKKIMCCLASAAIIVSAVPLVSLADLVDLVGKDRFDTANKIAKQYFKNSEKVIIVNSRAISDALSVAPLANKYNSPVLLVDRDNINKETFDTIKNLKPKEILIIGGESSVSKNLENKLSKEYKVDRITGMNRIETSKNIANKLGMNPEKLFIVNGYSGLSDAASAGALAAKLGVPLLLVNNDEKVFKNTINETKSKKVFLVGGETILPKSFEKYANIERISGKNRRDTNAQLLNRFYKGNVPTVFIAKDGSSNESEIIDSVAIGGVAGRLGMPLMLSSKVNGITNEQKNILRESNVRNVIGVGGGNEIAGKQIRSDIKNIVVNIPEEKKTEDNTQNSPNSGGGNSGGVIKPSEKTNDDIKKEVNVQLSKLVDEVGANAGVKALADIKFDGNDTTNITIKEIDPEKIDLKKINNTGFITGLLKVKGLKSYKIKGVEDTGSEIKGAKENELKNKIIEDVTKALSLNNSDLETVNEKNIIVEAKLENKDKTFDVEYKFNFKVSADAINNYEKKKLEDNVEEKLEDLINSVVRNPSINKFVDMTFDKETDTTIIDVKTKNIEDIKNVQDISGTGFIKGLKAEDKHLVSYKVGNNDERNIKTLEESQLKSFILQDVISYMNLKEIKNINDLNNKEVIVKTVIEKDGIRIEKNYTFLFQIKNA